MAIKNSIRDVTDFLQQNEALVEAIKDAGKGTKEAIESLNERLEANRRDAQVLVDQVGAIKFAVSKNADTRQRQKLILSKIEQVSKDIQIFADEPDILIMLFIERSGLYMALGNSYNDLVSQIVSFSPEEIDELRVLLRRATLDAVSRQALAHVLDAAIQISKLALRVAVKLAT